MKKIGLFVGAVITSLALAGCNGSAETTALSEEKLVVGVTSGPHEQILEVVKEVAAEEGLELELKVFTDYVLPNTALEEGDLDVNSYQHKPFLDAFNEDHGTNLVAGATTILNPMGVYSNEFGSIEDLPKGAKFGLPNDPTNGSRALFILEEAGLITLKEGSEETASIFDVEENKLELEFIELEAAQIPKQLSELDAAAINTNWAIEAGLNTLEDSILLESSESPYVNYIVTRDENKDDPVLEVLNAAYQSDRVKEFIEEQFDGSVLPIW
ncbi:MetQ/NlpA family ABC transporter substrate-binding protein [Planomicrobium sp. YIM 101495]|uniref:MetQ/NlpA family ABC transporter substrate-binding protein n=1 Tax=Planomicrobium sp. YIM 101495 TaxID=2665160 RepID=UPI0012B71427|nr:MetQ/NlpA family ABC transporter substrate-binding protein [Planomicrobium sp. YIM 101495]MTD31423.1 metal ABC transporter substrate-binding protein [Planomicrobium sp. YIM 101495]